MNGEQRFKGYAARMREMFPTWTAIRKDPDSIGGQFLSVIGMKLDEVDWLLRYAYDQVYIGTADIGHVDLVYKARIPNSLTPNMNFRLSGHSHILHPKATELEFLMDVKSTGLHTELQYDTACYVDYEEKMVYVKHPFGKDDTHAYGYLTLMVHNSETPDIEPAREQLPLSASAVWNFFDEFGLLLGVNRLEGERNAAYRERILDVFRRPANATKEGLQNGIARELGLTRTVNWKDATQELTLRQPRISAPSIRVNGEPIGDTGWRFDEDGAVVLSAQAEGGERTVQYTAGISLHELHDTSDTAFQKELYNIDGSATPLLTYYVETIRRHAPVMWGEWRWNQGTWEAGEAEYAGYNTLPTLLDGSFSGWIKEEGIN